MEINTARIHTSCTLYAQLMDPPYHINKIKDQLSEATRINAQSASQAWKEISDEISEEALDRITMMKGTLVHQE
jgi:hypothetical protein